MSKRLRFFMVRWLGGFCIAILFAIPVAAQPAHLLVRSGQIAVDTSGQRFYGLAHDNAETPAELPAPQMAGDLIALHATLSDQNGAPLTTRGVWLLHKNAVGRLVARSGSAAPNTESGTVFTQFDLTQTHEFGRLLLTARLQGPGVSQGINDYGIWEADMSHTALVVRSVDVAPGTEPTGYFRTITEPILLDGTIGADLAFKSYVSSYPGAPPTLPVTTGIWARAGSDLEMVSWSYGAVPGLQSTWFSEAHHQVGPSGQGATVARIYGPHISTITVNGTSVSDDWVVLRTEPGHRQIVARTANQAPGTPAGVLFRSLAGPTSLPAINSTGDAIFNATVIGPGVTTGSSTGLWRSTASGVSLVARGGEPAPAAGAGVVFDALYSNHTSGSLAVMNNGDAVFWTYFSGTGVTLNNVRGIYKRSTTGLDTLIARSGVTHSALPAGTTLLRTTMPLVMKTAGDDHLMFTAQLSGSSVTTTNNDVLLRHRETSGLQLVAREGDSVGSYILKSFVNNGASLQLSTNGFAVVPVTLVPASNPNSTPRLGILGVTQTGAVSVLVVEGSALSLDDGTSPIVQSLRLSDSGALNESGEVAFAVQFNSSPRDEAVVVSTISSQFSCPADFDESGSVNEIDLSLFLGAWFAREMSADFDQSGSIGTPDIFSYLSRWFDRC